MPPTEARSALRRSLILLTLCAAGMVACATFTRRDTSSWLGAAPTPSGPGASDEHVEAASAGCLSCHTGIENENMHANNLVAIGCADCHGGHADVRWSGGVPKKPWPPDFAAALQRAHVQPMFADEWPGSG